MEKRLDPKDPYLQDAYKCLIDDQNYRIIYHILHKLGQRRTDQNYNDMYQEGCFAFVAGYVDFRHKFPDKWEQPDGLSKCISYIFRRVWFRLLDQLKHGYYLYDHNTSYEAQVSNDEDYSYFDTLSYSDPDHESKLAHLKLWRAIYQAATVGEKRYLKGALELNLTDAEMAKHYHVTRQTIYGWRQQVIAHARRLKRYIEAA